MLGDVIKGGPFGANSMSWRDGTRLFLDIWPLIQRHVPDDDFRADFVRELIDYFARCDMDPADLRRVHPEIDKALDELGVSKG
jgi:hypothetical protein